MYPLQRCPPNKRQYQGGRLPLYPTGDASKQNYRLQEYWFQVSYLLPSQERDEKMKSYAQDCFSEKTEKVHCLGTKADQRINLLLQVGATGSLSQPQAVKC